VWWLGGIYSPNNQNGRWKGLLSMGAPDSPVRQPHHPTVRVRPLELLTAGPPDSLVVHRIVSVHCLVRLLAPALTLRALSAHCSLLQTTVGTVSRCSAWHTGQYGATPDSPVNNSRVAFPETRRWRVRVDPPWCTGHCPVAHQIVQCARPRQPSVFFCSFLLNPILGFLLVLC
jgi:hypothetical protein